MRTIAIGLSVGALALFTFIQFDSNANADHDCPASNCGGGFVDLFGIVSALTAEGDFTFEENGKMKWCFDEEENPYIGAMIINPETVGADFQDLDADPDFFNPAHCTGEVDTFVSGQLSGNTNPATLVLRAFCFSPMEFDDEEIVISEP